MLKQKEPSGLTLYTKKRKLRINLNENWEKGEEKGWIIQFIENAIKIIQKEKKTLLEDIK